MCSTMGKWNQYYLKILKFSLTMNLFCILLLLTSHTCVLGVEYGPSISSLTGVFVNWRGPDIFSVESGRKVKLEGYPGFAAVIPLITGDSKATSEQIFQERGISTVGEFIVEAPRGFGILAVIQELKLRKLTRERATNVTCSDYLQIGRIGGPESSSVVSSKICGTVNRDDLSLQPEGLLGPRTFRSGSGKLRIAFNHAYVAELVDSLLGSKQKHILRAEVAFTAYKVNCYDESTNTTTVPSNEEDSFEVCSDYSKSGNQTCISSKLLCDDIYNCGGDGDTLGSDDSLSSCPDKPVRTTTEKSPEEENNDDKQDGLGSLASYLGIPSLSSFTTRKYERKFRPYVSSSGSGYSGFEFNTRRTSTENTPPASSSTTEAISEGSSAAKTLDSSSNSDSNQENILHQEDEIYNRRELSHAINSVIYGVAVFIIFTIFITVFVVCITKKIQMTLSARSARNSIGSDSTSTTVSTPSIIPTTTTTVITHNRTDSNCNPINNGGIAYGPPNTTVVLLTIPQSAEQYDLPPSYDTLFPVPSEC